MCSRSGTGNPHPVWHTHQMDQAPHAQIGDLIVTQVQRREVGMVHDTVHDPVHADALDPAPPQHQRVQRRARAHHLQDREHPAVPRDHVPDRDNVRPKVGARVGAAADVQGLKTEVSRLLGKRGEDLRGGWGCRVQKGLWGESTARDSNRWRLRSGGSRAAPAAVGDHPMAVEVNGRCSITTATATQC